MERRSRSPPIEHNGDNIVVYGGCQGHFARTLHLLGRHQLPLQQKVKVTLIGHKSGETVLRFLPVLGICDNPPIPKFKIHVALS